MAVSRPKPKTETQEHKTISSYFRKIGLGAGAMAIHIRNENGSAWERIVGKQMGVVSGIPDWLIIHGGYAMFIELKPRGFNEKLARGVGMTEHVRNQLSVHASLKAAGCWVCICETLEEVLDTLRAHGVPLRSESLSNERIRRAIKTVMKEETGDGKW